MKLIYTKYFLQRFQKRVRKKPALRNQVNRQLALLMADRKHPSLKTHKLKGQWAKEYAIWIEANLRITFLIEEDEIVLTDLITHDEYKRSKRSN